MKAYLVLYKIKTSPALRSQAKGAQQLALFLTPLVFLDTTSNDH
jgi:hypothetical protein